jgi:hypothetical protein
MNTSYILIKKGGENCKKIYVPSTIITKNIGTCIFNADFTLLFTDSSVYQKLILRELHGFKGRTFTLLLY